MQFSTNEITKSFTHLHCLSGILPTGLPLYLGGGILMKEIPLSKQGKHKGKYFALVDDEDYEWLNKFNWSIVRGCSTLYARRIFKGNFISMHRLILGVTDSKIFGDHIDHNGLNNQRYNIRTCTKSQNQSNVTPHKNKSSKYLGVFKYKNGWVSRCDKKTIKRSEAYIGYFNNEIEAALAYNKRAIELHGEFANLNKIETT